MSTEPQTWGEFQEGNAEKDHQLSGFNEKAGRGEMRLDCKMLQCPNGLQTMSAQDVESVIVLHTE